VRVPVAAIVGSRDEYLDRRPRELIDAFGHNAVRAAAFTGAVVAGAGHGFQRREGAVARVIVDWLRDRGLTRP
jgi:hypothetical protein